MNVVGQLRPLVGSASSSFLAPSGHQCFVAIHAEDSLRSASIAQVLDLPLTIAALEAIGAKRLVSGQYGQILNLVPTTATTICAIIADQGAIA
jgi:hypothetical protein